MKVLQTLGRHGGAQEGVFQYKRNARGVDIDGSIGQARLDPPRALITTAEWTRILTAIEQAARLSLSRGTYPKESVSCNRGKGTRRSK